MTLKRHANATTTPEMREFIRSSDLSVAALARLLNIGEATVRKWKRRDTVEDASHMARHLQTTLTPVQEYVVIELRKNLQLTLDELLQVTQQFVNPQVSRSGLARCLKRHGVSRLADVRDEETEPGFKSSGEQLDGEAVHLSVEHIPTHKEIQPPVTKDALAQALADGDHAAVVSVEAKKIPKLEGSTDEDAEKSFFVANDPDSGWVYVDIFDGDPAQAALRYMSHAFRNAPFHIRKILAGNYSEFMSRYRVLGEDNKGSIRESASEDSILKNIENSVESSIENNEDQNQNLEPTEY